MKNSKPKPKEDGGGYPYPWEVISLFSSPLEVKLREYATAPGIGEKWLQFDGSQQAQLYLFMKRSREVEDMWMDNEDDSSEKFVATCESAYRALTNLGGNAAEIEQKYGIKKQSIGFILSQWLYAVLDGVEDRLDLMRMARDKHNDLSHEDLKFLVLTAYGIDIAKAHPEVIKDRGSKQLDSEVQTFCLETLAGLVPVLSMADRAIAMGVDFPGLPATAYKKDIANEATFLLDLLEPGHQSIDDYVTSQQLLYQTRSPPGFDQETELKDAALNIKGMNLRVVDEAPPGYVGLQEAAHIFTSKGNRFSDAIARFTMPAERKDAIRRKAMLGLFNAVIGEQLEGVRVRGTTDVYVSQSSLRDYKDRVQTQGLVPVAGRSS